MRIHPWLFVALLLFAGLAPLSTVHAAGVSKEWTTTADFNGGTKSQPSPVDGNYQVETFTDNGIIPANRLELGNKFGDHFDLPSLIPTWKWNKILGNVVCTMASTSEAVESGVLRQYVVAGAGTCRLGVVSTDGFNGDWRFSVKLGHSTNATNAEMYEFWANTSPTAGSITPLAYCPAGTWGFYYRWRVGAGGFEFYKCVNGVLTQIGGTTAIVGTPLWMRVSRVGTVFVAYYSADGITWIQDYTYTDLTFTGSVYLEMTTVQTAGSAQADWDDFRADSVATGITTVGNGWRTAGTWLSDTYAVASTLLVSQVILSTESLTANWFINVVDIYQNGTLKQSWASNLVSGTLHEFNVTTTVTYNVTVKVGLMGDGTGSPSVTAVGLVLGTQLLAQRYQELFSVDTNVGSNCNAYAGTGLRLRLGYDTNQDGILQGSEVTETWYLCNGADGATGPQGPTGPGGANGTQGPPGATGSPATGSDWALLVGLSLFVLFAAVGLARRNTVVLLLAGITGILTGIQSAISGLNVIWTFAIMGIGVLFLALAVKYGE